MQRVLWTEQTRALSRWLTANANTSSYASKVPTTAEPVNDGVQNFPQGGGQLGGVPPYLLLWPIGAGGDNDTFNLKVIGWRRIGSGNVPNVLWVPSPLADLSCTLCAAVGVASSPVLATERFCDTITVNQEGTTTAATTRAGNVVTYSPTGDLIGFVRVPLSGFEKVELIFDQTLNTPTMNALYSLV